MASADLHAHLFAHLQHHSVAAAAAAAAAVHTHFAAAAAVAAAVHSHFAAALGAVAAVILLLKQHVQCSAAQLSCQLLVGLLAAAVVSLHDYVLAAACPAGWVLEAWRPSDTVLSSGLTVPLTAGCWGHLLSGSAPQPVHQSAVL